MIARINSLSLIDEFVTIRRGFFDKIDKRYIPSTRLDAAVAQIRQLCDSETPSK